MLREHLDARTKFLPRIKSTFHGGKFVSFAMCLSGV